MRKWQGVLAVGLAVVAADASAAVASSSPAGFVVKFEVPLAVSRADAYTKLLEVGKWWSDGHTYSGSASNLTIAREPGGCFCEKLKDGGFVRHMSVESVMAPALLRLSGALGPLADFGAHGSLTFQLSAASDGKATTLVATYIVGGYNAGSGLQEMAAPVDGVLKEQLDRFKRFVETGKPAPESSRHGAC